MILNNWMPKLPSWHKLAAEMFLPWATLGQPHRKKREHPCLCSHDRFYPTVTEVQHMNIDHSTCCTESMYSNGWSILTFLPYLMITSSWWWTCWLFIGIDLSTMKKSPLLENILAVSCNSWEPLATVESFRTGQQTCATWKIFTKSCSSSLDTLHSSTSCLVDGWSSPSSLKHVFLMDWSTMKPAIVKDFGDNGYWPWIKNHHEFKILAAHGDDCFFLDCHSTHYSPCSSWL